MDKIVKTVMSKLTKGRYDTTIFNQLIRLENKVSVKDDNSIICSNVPLNEFCPFLKKGLFKKRIAGT